MVTVSARLDLVRFGQSRGLSERHALRLAGMSASLLRYRRREDRNQVLRQRIVDLAHRQPSLRPSRQNEVWLVDFVFDREADGRILKCLTVVNGCTHEAVAVHPDRSLSGAYAPRILDRLKPERGLPKVIRSDYGSEFCRKAMLIWAREDGVAPGLQRASTEEGPGRTAAGNLRGAIGGSLGDGNSVYLNRGL